MQQAEWMDQLVYDLLARYEADVLPSGLLSLELRMKGHGTLLIEEKWKHKQMYVGYLLFDGDGNPVPEPALWFYIDPGGHWLPYEIQRMTAGHYAFADIDRQSGELIVLDAKNQAALACFADFWAEILRAQGWLDQAQKQTRHGLTALDGQREPGEQPDLTTLMQWMDTDGGCEATDGCWLVEPDSVCEHGHPSWLVELGLI